MTGKGGLKAGPMSQPLIFGVQVVLRSCKESGRIVLTCSRSENRASGG